MPIAGLGLYPVGFNPLGFGYETPPDETAAGAGVRYLDPTTKDYAVDSDGYVLLGSPERQRVVVLLTTTLRTSLAVRGIAVPEVHDATTERFMKNEVRTALQPVLTDGSVELESVTVATEVDRVPGRLGIGVVFRNTRTGELERADV